MQQPSSLSELVNSLDAATYFFVSSGAVIGVTALLFFVFGIWFGRLLWGRYKRRLREAEDVIEAFKGEVAQLKRRIAEQAIRPLPSMGPSPLQSIAFKAVAPGEKAHTVLQPVSLPPSRAFTLWAPPVPPTPARQAVSRSASSLTPEELAAIPPLEVFMAPRSRAFGIWTAREWKQPTVKGWPAPPANPFTLWTRPDFTPLCRGPVVRSAAHSAWTEAAWSAPRISGPPPRSARSFSVWTEPGWKPLPPPVWSTAFSLWTQPDYDPACRGAVPPSQAHTVWTDSGWMVPPVKPQPAWQAHPFSVWAEPPLAVRAAPAKAKPKSQAAMVAAAASAVASIAAQPSGGGGRGLVARAIARAKSALGLGTARTVPASVEKPLPPPAPAGEPAAKQAVPSKPVPAQASQAVPKAAPKPAPAPAGTVPAPTGAVPPKGGGPPKVLPKPPQAAAPKPVPSVPAPVPKVTAAAEAAKPPKPVPPAPAAIPPMPAPTSGAPSPSNLQPVTRPNGHPPAPVAPVTPPKISSKAPPPVPAVLASLSETAAAVAALHRPVHVVAAVDAVPRTSATPPSRAFTLWTGDPSAIPTKNITQRIALAALIESKVGTGKVALPPIPAPTPAPVAGPPKLERVLPVPAVPTLEAAEPAADSRQGSRD